MFDETQRHDPDLTLVRAMAAGNVRALDQLYELYGGRILSYLMARLDDRQAAEEILQDVMLAAWENAADFRGESRVYTWLLAIARNRSINAHRRRTPPSLSLDEAVGDFSGDTGPQERVERNATYTAVREALNRLPDIQREILVLTFYHQLSGPEIAEVLGITVGTVKSRLHRAKAALQKVLESEGSL